MTAPETFTTVFKAILDEGCRPVMTGICASLPAGVDVKRALPRTPRLGGRRNAVEDVLPYSLRALIA